MPTNPITSTRPAEAARVAEESAVVDALLTLVRLGEMRRARIAAQCAPAPVGTTPAAAEQATQEGKSH